MAYGSALVDNIQSSTAGTPVVFKDGNSTEIGTLCRAWVNFNGTGTVAIRASFNVSSITDNGTGNYTVNLTNALSDTNYGISAFARYTGTDDYGLFVSTLSNMSKTTSAMQIQVRAGSSLGTSDSSEVDVAFFR